MAAVQVMMLILFKMIKMTKMCSFQDDNAQHVVFLPRMNIGGRNIKDYLRGMTIEECARCEAFL